MNSTCDVTEYTKWLNKPYSDELTQSTLLAITSIQRSDKKMYKIMDFENSRERFFSGDLQITNRQIMGITESLCRKSLLRLERNLAGTHGPIKDRDVHDAMCSKDCLLNDHLRSLSMIESGCDCLELSLSVDDPGFKEEGSFCRVNSGEFLCQDLKRCGKWKCGLNDYGCKRIEYNRQRVPLRGYGDDCNHTICLQTKTLHIILILLIGTYYLF